MSKKEKQAYRRGAFEAITTILVISFYAGIFIGFMAR